MATEPTQLRVGAGRIVLLRADLTTLDYDAVVNAANQSLAGGGGVDGAIHRAAGPTVMAELKQRYSSCPTGSAVITGGGRLAARHIIHAVGPRYRDGDRGEAEHLRSAYRRAFELAAENQLQTVACASLSTGIYGFPVAEAAPVALGEAATALRAPGTSLREIAWALFSDGDLAAYAEALSGVSGDSADGVGDDSADDSDS